jgi:hypothetical protein
MSNRILRFPKWALDKRMYQFSIIRLQSRVYQRWLRVLIAGDDREPTLEFYTHCFIIPVNRRWKDTKTATMKKS